MRVILPAAYTGMRTGVIRHVARDWRDRAADHHRRADVIAFLPRASARRLTVLPIQIFNWVIATAAWLSRHRRLGDHRAAGRAANDDAIAVFLRDRARRIVQWYPATSPLAVDGADGSIAAKLQDLSLWYCTFKAIETSPSPSR